MMRLIICTPTRDTISPETQIALRDNLDGFDAVHLVEQGKPVADARNALTLRARAIGREQPGTWAVLWCDDDAWWGRGTVARLVATLQEHPEIAILGGLHCLRRSSPGAYRARGTSPVGVRADGKPWTNANELVELRSGLGSHFMLHRVELLGALAARGYADPWSQAYGLPEVAMFGLRVAAERLRTFVLTSPRIAHVERSGAMYFPLDEQAYALRDGAPVAVSAPAITEERREYGFTPDTPLQNYSAGELLLALGIAGLAKAMTPQGEHPANTLLKFVGVIH